MDAKDYVLRLRRIGQHDIADYLERLQQNDGDLISRKTALAIVERNAFHEGREWVFRGRIMRELEEAPAVVVEPVRHGRWILYDVREYADGLCIPEYKCSECGKIEVVKEPYCNCGAKMDAEANGDE